MGNEPLGRTIRGTDLIDLASAKGKVNRTLRHIGSYLGELGPNDRKDTLGKVAELLNKSARIDQLFVNWIEEERGST